jgi:Mrp family chromosome partitioning ATPase
VLGSLESPGGTILLAGVRGAEGMADVAANLAMALAATGRSVAVVTVDGERPDVADRFDVDGPGLAEVLSGVVPLSEALLQPRWLPVSVLPRGSRDVPVSDLVQSEAMHRMHRTLLAETDFVLLAAPPVLAAADAVAMASLADAAVLVTSAKRTSARDLRAVRARMARVGFPVLGAVLHGSAGAPAGPPREGPLEALPPASPTDDGAEAPVPAGAPH